MANATKQLRNLEVRIHKIAQLQYQLDKESSEDRKNLLRDMLDFQCDEFQNEFNDYRVKI